MQKFSSHQVWATVSGRDRDDIMKQIDSLVCWGVRAIEFRVDLIPEALWDSILGIGSLPVPWWVAHFGTGKDADTAKTAIAETLRSDAEGAIFHSRCEHLSDLIAMCQKAGRPFAAPYHSQNPMTRNEAIREFEYQATLTPAFRKIAARARTYAEAAAIVDATHTASKAGGSPVVGAVFGPQRWARIALPHAGSAITFILAHAVENEVGGDDQQLHLGDIHHLSAVKDLLAIQRGAHASTIH
ncbi:protein of unknown function [Nitrospira japonica]|uniref:Xylose isomerase-like TIM barrel domain-containing protein n=1 Tax=Nitrospira japonica TaxID=1325564 RepID=A0A1W1IAA8_9BACT|nr:type I 3-dehydroquinate dehydratase [Nitrospira japonica]SLM49936.1 protein of unknown function [Nitrospira japonica]